MSQEYSICEKATDLSDFEGWCYVDAILGSEGYKNYYETCGVLYERIDEKWCDFDREGDGACCGGFDDCCKKNVWFSMTISVVIFAFLILCGFCGRRFGCCGMKRPAKRRSLPAVSCFEHSTILPSPTNSTESVTTVFYHPDGAVEKRTETVNPDGSKSVTLVVETTVRGPDPDSPIKAVPLEVLAV